MFTAMFDVHLSNQAVERLTPTVLILIHVIRYRLTDSGGYWSLCYRYVPYCLHIFCTFPSYFHDLQSTVTDCKKYAPLASRNTRS